MHPWDGAGPEFSTSSPGIRQESDDSTSGARTAVPTVTKGGEASEYEVQSESATTKDTFNILRKSTGEVERTCLPKGKNGCPASGKW